MAMPDPGDTESKQRAMVHVSLAQAGVGMGGEKQPTKGGLF